MLRDGAVEVSATEKSRFEGLGKITIDEMINVHYELEKLNSLPDKIENE
jgi:hypothetical protein